MSQLKTKIAAQSCTAGARLAVDSYSEEEEDGETGIQRSVSGCSTRQSPAAPTVSKKGQGKRARSKAADKEAEALVDKLTEQQEATDKLQSKIQIIFQDSMGDMAYCYVALPAWPNP